MAKRGSYFRHGYEHEPAVGHTRMRNLEVGRADDAGPVKQNINIHSSRPRVNDAFAAELLLDATNNMEQLPGHKLRFRFDGNVQEPALRLKSDRLSLVERGAPRDAHSRIRQQLKRALNVRGAVAQI